MAERSTSIFVVTSADISICARIEAKKKYMLALLFV